MAPNIRTERDQHRNYCHQSGDTAPEWPRVGDVRRCRHGRVQVAWRPYVNVFSPEWRTISRVWEPLTYRRALQALKRFPAPTPEPTDQETS